MSMGDADFTEEDCMSIVEGMTSAKFNLLAVDFDLTLVDQHTDGQYEGTPAALSQRVRPFFLTLIPIAIEKGISVGIVTFSPQTQLIGEVMELCFPGLQIPIRGNDGSWGPVPPRRNGKQPHIASVASELNERGIVTRRCSTLLIDDDRDNVKMAMSHRIPAQRCFPEDIRRMVAELLTIFSIEDDEQDHVF